MAKPYFDEMLKLEGGHGPKKVTYIGLIPKRMLRMRKKVKRKVRRRRTPSRKMKRTASPRSWRS